MDRQFGKQQMVRERATYRYLESLDSGDIDGIIEVLQQAAYDAPLDQMVAEAHQAYCQDEQTRKVAPGVMDTHEMPILEPATLRSRGSGQRRRAGVRQMSRWAKALAAVLILGVLVGSFVTVLALRKQGQQGTLTLLPVCQPYPLKQFDVRNTITAAVSLNSLSSVTSVSANDAWAVGYAYSVPGDQAVSPFIEHWDGRSWQIVPSQHSAAGNGSFSAVEAVSVNDVWAVGYSYHGPLPPGESLSSMSKTLIEHWDGKSWQIMPSPNSTTGNGLLNALTVVTHNDIWAVGSFEDANHLVRPLLEHWDGIDWQIVSLQGRNALTVGWLSSVVAVSANDVWAVGIGRNAGETQVHGLVERWNGSQWQSQPAPQASEALNSISAISAHNIWAVGDDTHGNLLIEHWDGQKWSSVALPGSLVRAESGVSITAASANNIWALGNVKGSDQVNHMLILHWNGKSWQQVFPPALQLPANTANTFAGGITVSGGQIWIVGNARDSEGGYSSALILGQRTCP